MNKPSNLLRGTGRAATGAIIAGVAVVAVIGFGTIPLPEITADVPEIEVSTVNNSTRTSACTGGFAWLGADSEHSNEVIPTGEAKITSFGATGKKVEHNEGDSAASGTAFRAKGDKPFAASQKQSFDNEDLYGTAALACTEPLTDQWLVGGTTTLGNTASLTVVNPGDRPATVGVSVYHEDGPANDGEHTGVLVPAGQARSLSVNGLAPARDQVAVHVQSTGSPVTASLSTSASVDIHPQGIDTVTAQASPQKELVIPGLKSHEDATDTDAETHDTNMLRLLNTEDTDGTAELYALRKNGKRAHLGSVKVESGKVVETPLEDWPDNATAAYVESDVTLVGSALAHSMEGGDTDFGWFPASGKITEDTGTTIVSGGELTLANPSDSEIEVTLTDAEDEKKQKTVKIGAEAADTVKAPSDKIIVSSKSPIYGGVRIVKGANSAAYPVAPLSSRAKSMTVYPK